MAVLLAVLIIAGLFLASALPFWATLVKREREAELLWRGTQYARAIDLFRQKYGYVFPPDVDTLLRERFLRKKYTDPMVADGEFELLYAVQLSGGNVPSNLADPLNQPQDAAMAAEALSASSAEARTRASAGSTAQAGTTNGRLRRRRSTAAGRRAAAP